MRDVVADAYKCGRPDGQGIQKSAQLLTVREDVDGLGETVFGADGKTVFCMQSQ